MRIIKPINTLIREKIIDKIDNIQETINTNLLNLKIFQSVSDALLEAWLQEILTIIHKINGYRIKPSRKRLKQEEYFEILYEWPFDDDDSTEYFNHFIKGIFLNKENENINSEYRNKEIPENMLKKWKNDLKVFYIGITKRLSSDYLSLDEIKRFVKKFKNS